MFKKALIIFLISESCIAIDSPRGQFLKFVDTTITEGLESVKGKIEMNATEEGQYKSLSKAFKDNFGQCFLGTALDVPISHTHSNTLFSAAQTLGLAFLTSGQQTENIEHLKVALAFFKSIPGDFAQTASGETSDTCVVDFADIAEKERIALEDKQAKLYQLETVDLSGLQ